MKRILLTGASSGIGLAIAQALVARGDEVWGTSRDPARIPQLPRLHPIRLDLADSNSINSAFATALGEAGHFDVVINNAGSGHFSARELSEKEIANQFQVLVFGQLQLMRLALKAMRAREQGLSSTSLRSRHVYRCHLWPLIIRPKRRSRLLRCRSNSNCQIRKFTLSISNPAISARISTTR